MAQQVMPTLSGHEFSHDPSARFFFNFERDRLCRNRFLSGDGDGLFPLALPALACS